MKIRVLQHVDFEGPANLAVWAKSKGHSFSITRLFLGEPLPETDSFDLLIVMGGPMGAYDEGEFEWMGPEKRLIAEAIRRGKKVLGICLGAQLIAEVLGARVYPHRWREIGWYPVEGSPKAEKLDLVGFLPSAMNVFHWHGDTFDLPKGAVPLFRSSVCENQGFLYKNRVLALQFHLEMSESAVKILVKRGADELREAQPFVEPAASILAQAKPRTKALYPFLTGLMDRFARLG